MNRVATVAGLWGLLLAGVAEASYGPALPYLQVGFNLTPGVAGTIVGAHFAGIVVGSLLTMPLARWLNRPARLACELLFLGVAWLALAAAQAWPLMLVAAFAVGVGEGGMVVDFNVAFATGFGRRSASMTTLLNAMFGVGAVAAPALILMSALPLGGYRQVWGGGGVAARVLVAMALRVPPSGQARVDVRIRAKRGLFLRFVGLLFLYVGIEQTIGAWESTYLVATGFSLVHAASSAALFWTALTLGRSAGAGLLLRARVDVAVICGFLLAVPAILLTMVPGAAVAGFTLTGLALAPIFPAGFVWFQRRVHNAEAYSGLCLAGAQAGAAIVPVVVGEMITVLGIAVLPWVILACLLGGSFGGALLSRKVGLAPAPADAEPHASWRRPPPSIRSGGAMPFLGGKHAFQVLSVTVGVRPLPVAVAPCTRRVGVNEHRTFRP